MSVKSWVIMPLFALLVGVVMGFPLMLALDILTNGYIAGPGFTSCYWASVFFYTAIRAAVLMTRIHDDINKYW